MATIRVNGLEMGYAVVGSGPPLIALHGATMSGRDEFDRRLPALSADHEVFLPDARGHATTRWDVTTGGFDTRSLVADVVAFADGLGLDRFHLFGFSMGGMTALTLAVQSPDRLRSLVAAGISPAREPRAAVVRRMLDPERIERDDPAWAGRLEARHGPTQGRAAWRSLLPAIAADVADQPLISPAELHSVRVPTLVACGDRDPFVPVHQAVDLARQLRAGRLLVVPGRGHDIVSGTSPELDAAITAFYRSVGTST
jgi:pimeloyl-ACP methyl ester carboxylesterase